MSNWSDKPYPILQAIVLVFCVVMIVFCFELAYETNDANYLIGLIPFGYTAYGIYDFDG